MAGVLGTHDYPFPCHYCCHRLEGLTASLLKVGAIELPDVGKVFPQGLGGGGPKGAAGAASKVGVCDTAAGRGTVLMCVLWGVC